MAWQHEQAIILANVDPDLYHMMSPGYNELRHWTVFAWSADPRRSARNFFFQASKFSCQAGKFSYFHIKFWCSNYVWVITGRFNGSIVQLQWVEGRLVWCQSKLIMIVNLISLLFNSLWPSYAIRWHESRSTVAQVMACCLTAPSHYQTQRWLIISEIFWHSPEGNLTLNAQDI